MAVLGNELNPAVDRILPGVVPRAPNATATAGSSTAPKPGAPARSPRTMDWCLARTQWDGTQARRADDVPGAPSAHPGIHVRHIHHVEPVPRSSARSSSTGWIGDDAVVGEVNGGWAVASRQLYHERRAVGQGSRFAEWPRQRGGNSRSVLTDYVERLWRKPVRSTARRVRRRWRAACWCIAR